jgi:hypothetical protein
MTLFGYARVSTIDQDLGIQEAALRAAGCQTIRSEKKSGVERGARTELQILLDFLRAGDTLVVTRIDRLARSMNCFDDLSRSFSWRHLDACGAADLKAVRSVPEGDAAGLEKEIAYFQSEVAAARYLGAATGAGESAESADGRLAKMQERLPAPRPSATAAVTDEAAPATGDEGLVGNADASVWPVDLGY